MKTILTVAALSLLSGCAGNVWYVDGRFTPSETQEIQQAAELWTETGNPIDIITGVKLTGLKVDRKEFFKTDSRGIGFLFPNQPKDNWGVEGLRSSDGMRIAINFETITEPVFNVAVHEFGHSLGLKHVDNPLAIMGNSSSMLGCLTRADIAEMRRVGLVISVRQGCDE